MLISGYSWQNYVRSLNELKFIDALAPCMARPPGGHLNKKDGLTKYGDSHVKDKTS